MMDLVPLTELVGELRQRLLDEIGGSVPAASRRSRTLIEIAKSEKIGYQTIYRFAHGAPIGLHGLFGLMHRYGYLVNRPQEKAKKIRNSCHPLLTL
jgi:hypothetical protein